MNPVKKHLEPVCALYSRIDKYRKMSLEKAVQPSKTNRNVMNAPKKRGKRDYIVQYITDFEVGEAGESLVYKYECSLINKAIKQGRIDKFICVK